MVFSDRKLAEKCKEMLWHWNYRIEEFELDKYKEVVDKGICLHYVKVKKSDVEINWKHHYEVLEVRKQQYINYNNEICWTDDWDWIISVQLYASSEDIAKEKALEFVKNSF